MYAAFLTIVAAGGMYFLLSHRRFDVFSLAFFSGCIYFLPGFFGSVLDPGSETPVPIESGTYVVMATVLTAIVAGGWWFGRDDDVNVPERALVFDRQGAHIALIIAFGSLAIALYMDGAIYLSSDKGEVLEGMSRWFRLYSLSAAIAAVLAFAHRQWKSLMLAGGLLLLNVYIGFRAMSAITLLAIFVIHFHRQGPRRFLRDNRRAVVIAVAIAAFFFVYKAIYKIIKLGEYEIVHDRLIDPQFYVASVMDSEPFVTQCILNEVVRTDFQTDGGYIFTGIVAQMTFFGNELGIQVTSFNDLFQPVLFGDIEFGLACNIWAEMLAAGGWPLLCCFLFAFVLTLRLLSRWLYVAHVSSQACVALSAAYLAFYIHRTDVCFQLTLQKRLIACWFLIAIASEVMHVLSGRRRWAPRPAAVRVRPVAWDSNPERDTEAVHS